MTGLQPVPVTNPQPLPQPAPAPEQPLIPVTGANLNLLGAFGLNFLGRLFTYLGVALLGMALSLHGLSRRFEL